MKQFEDARQMNKLGVAYFAQSEFESAIQSFQAAINLQPNYTDAYYNLGLAFVKMQRRLEAISAFEALLALTPDHLGGLFQLGCLWMVRQNYKSAIDLFKRIEQQEPQHVEALMNLATCYLYIGYLNEAKAYYLKVLGITPDDIQAYFNCGVIAMHQGRIKEAIEFYNTVLLAQPDYFPAHNNLGVAYLGLSNREQALLHFRAALQLQPKNEALQHSVDILTQDRNITSSPPDYIRSLFDSYADHYDAHLLDTLDYQVPKHLHELVQDKLKNKSLTVLDLGCGSGLMGELFKPYALSLTGVDLSPNMLSLAAQKNIYDQLIEMDILAYLNQDSAEYDLILAGDVFVYSGDLNELFSRIYTHLKVNGWLLFNAEISQEAFYQLTHSGRFSHSKKYLDQLAQDNKYHIFHYDVSPLRTQENATVYGHFYLLQKLC